MGSGKKQNYLPRDVCSLGWYTTLHGTHITNVLGFRRRRRSLGAFWSFLQVQRAIADCQENHYGVASVLHPNGEGKHREGGDGEGGIESSISPLPSDRKGERVGKAAMNGGIGVPPPLWHSGNSSLYYF